MPMSSMIAFAIKWAIAAIPALLLLGILGAVAVAAFGALAGFVALFR
jgi:hypothetical protein